MKKNNRTRKSIHCHETKCSGTMHKQRDAKRQWNRFLSHLLFGRLPFVLLFMTMSMTQIRPVFMSTFLGFVFVPAHMTHSGWKSSMLLVMMDDYMRM